MKWRIADLLWLMTILALCLICALQAREISQLERNASDVEYERGLMLLEFAADGKRIPVSVLSRPFNRSLRYGGGMTLGPLVICNGDLESAEYLIKTGIDLRTASNRNDGIEAAFWANSPELMRMVLESGQWRPWEVSNYLSYIDQHQYLVRGEKAEEKNTLYQQRKALMKQMLLNFSENGQASIVHNLKNDTHSDNDDPPER
jgi:hypothetical protein